MSTTPDTQKNKTIPSQLPNALRSNKRSGNKPGLILLKGIFWLALMIGLLVVLVMYYEIVWEFTAGNIFPALQTLFELAEGALDTLFLFVGVSASFAPMSTAYTGFVLALAIIYLVSRQGIKTYQRIQLKKQEVSQTYASAWDEWYGSLKDKTNNLKANAMERLFKWWTALDIYNKVFAVIFIILIGIPLLLLLSVILGNLFILVGGLLGLF